MCSGMLGILAEKTGRKLISLAGAGMTWRCPHSPV